MSSMSRSLRWKLILGCLGLAALEAPDSALVLVQDLHGPWRSAVRLAGAVASSEAPSLNPSPALIETAADASVVTEDPRVSDRNRPPRLSSRPLAVLAAR